MSGLIVSVSGLRGIVGEALTPEAARRYAHAAFAEALAGPVVVGGDSRPSGQWIRAVVQGELLATGRDVLDTGIVPTPTVGVLVRHHGAAGAIQVTASHNPPPYNGMKVFTGAGSVLDAQAGAAVRARFESMGAAVARAGAYARAEEVGRVTRIEDPFKPHLERILARVDEAAIRRRRWHVLVDSNGGAGGPFARQLLERLGCRVTMLGEAPTGAFAHPPEPTADHLVDVGPAVVQSGAAVGFCQDPDADRLAIIDEKGHYIGEEYTLALCVDHVLKRQPGPVVVNCATSRMTHDIARRFDCPCHLSAVGEANVVARMQEVGAVFGGEGNGGPIDPAVGWVRDSFVGMALVLDLLSQSDKPLSAHVARLPRYAIVKRVCPVAAEKLPAVFQKLRTRFADARANEQDGLRLDWPDGTWVLLRASNTEPIVRIIAEAADAEAACKRCDDVARLLEEPAA